MHMFFRVLMALFTATIFSAANAEYYEQPLEPGESIHFVDELLTIDEGGVIRDHTGLVLTKDEAVARITLPGPILVGIILGGASGGVFAIGSGQNLTGILLGVGIGGISGYWGALAAMTGGFGFVVYESAAVGGAWVGNKIQVRIK